MGNILSEIYYLFSFLCLLYPPKPTFSPDQISDLTGQVVIVTGMPAVSEAFPETGSFLTIHGHRRKCGNREGNHKSMKKHSSDKLTKIHSAIFSV